MRTGVLLLLPPLLLPLLLPPGAAEGDPLPAALVHLVRNAAISSVDDLRLLLQQEAGAVEEEEEVPEVLTNQTHGRFSRSLAVEAQPAQQAACKVRTEVMEVKRSMLDRSNTNFLLWPPCVEVQRCSGCCNTRALQCVPTATASRYLQVIKIEFRHSKPHYDKAVISVDDHVGCKCQSSSSSPSVSRLSAQSSPAPRRPPQLPPPAPPMTHGSKADLHRHDDLKRNQQHYGGEEREQVARRWQQGGYAQLVHWTQGAAGGGQRAVSGSGQDGGGGGEGAPRPDRPPGGGARDWGARTRYRPDRPQSDGSSPPPGPRRNSPADRRPSPPPPARTTDSGTGRGRPNVTRTQTATANHTLRREGEEGGSAHGGDPPGPERANQTGGEEERRQKLLEMIQCDHDRPPGPPGPPGDPGLPGPGLSTAAPASPPARRAALRPALPRRRRKHRKRISKAAMRAMLM